MTINDRLTMVAADPKLLVPASLRILFLAANCDDHARRRLDREVRAIEDRIRESTYRDCIELISKWAVRPSDLQKALLQHQPHIVHFSARGSPDGILLQVSDGSSRMVSGRAIARMFRTLKDNIRVVVFNACISEAQARSVTEHIDFAIGMKGAMHDDIATVFSTAFYMALSHGRSVLTAFEVGVTELALHGVDDDANPVLLSRSGADSSTALGPGLCKATIREQ